MIKYSCYKKHQNSSNKRHIPRFRSGFTIVELLVVIVTIGILASVTMVSYSGIRQRALEASMQTNLTNAAKQLQMFQTANINSQYPATLDCALPNSDTNLCVDTGIGNSVSYIPNNSAIVPSFSLTATSDNSTSFVVTNNSSPASTANIEVAGPWKAVTTGNYHACGIGIDDLAYCWGRNTNGQLGNNSIIQSEVPVPVYTTAGPLNGKTIKSISAGGWHTCAIASDNRAYCWGQGTDGQLGNNAIVQSQIPVAVYATAGVLLNKDIKSITTGAYHACAITTESKVYCWGYNAWGQIGDTTTTTRRVPTTVLASGVLSGRTIKTVVSSSNSIHTCVITDNDLIFCWGKGLAGELGNNVKANVLFPVAPIMTGELNGKTIKSVAVGLSRTCVVASDDLLYCWGSNGAGELGDGTIIERLVPAKVSTAGVLNGKTMVSVVSGSNHTCAFDSNSIVYCWGNSSTGILGTRSATATIVPVYVDMTDEFTGKTIAKISLGAIYTCALTTRSNLYCYGSNTNGRLGNGTIIDSLSPTKVISM